MCIVPASGQVVRFGTSWPLLFTCLCPAHITDRCSISLWCLPSSFSVLRWKNSRMCGCLLAPLSGITEWNHSYYTGISLSALHSLQQLQAGSSSPPSVQMSASTRVSHGAAPSSSVSCPTGHTQCCPSTGSDGAPPALPHVTFCQLRLLRLPRSSPLLLFWSVASLSTLPRRPQQPVSTPSLDVATQTFSHTPAASRDVSTQLSFVESLASPSTLDALCPACARPIPSLLLDAAVQAPLHRVATHDASTQPPLTEFFIGCILSNDPLDRQASPSAHCNAGSTSPPQPADIATLCSPSSASHASDGHEDTTAPRVLPQPPPVLEKYARQYASHCKIFDTAPVRPLRVRLSQSRPPQPHVSTTQVGTHPVRSAATYKRSASTALAGTHNPVGADPRARTGPFTEPRALVLPMVKFGQSKSSGPSPIATADSDLMHHQYCLSVLQWNPGPARRHRTNIIAAACGRFHAVTLQEASDHVPHISDQINAYTGNTDIAILLNKDTFEP